jgi:hypothetical protein
MMKKGKFIFSHFFSPYEQQDMNFDRPKTGKVDKFETKQSKIYRIKQKIIEETKSCSKYGTLEKFKNTSSR